MTRLTRRGAIGTLGAGAALLAAPALAQSRPITVGALRFTSHAGTFVALERGHFADAGLDVELKFFQAAPPMAAAIASGDVDYAVTAMSGGLVNLAAKDAIRVIGGALTEEQGIDGQLILASDAAFQDGLTSPAMLDGRSFGISAAGSSFHYMGSRIAQAEGATLTYKPLQKVPAIIGALKSGQIDAWAIVPHIAKPLAASGAVHVIGDVATYLPEYQVTTIFTSKANADGERDMTAAFLDAYSKGAAAYNAVMIDGEGGQEGQDAMVALLAPYVYPDRSVEEATSPIVLGTMRLQPNARIDMASLADQLEWFQSEGLVDSSIALETVVDPSYVETVS